ncbi:MAG: restriction endonuclease, partial [Spirochaetaceae bacterium]|nr:restriction endonuclease [Spirochaetaceae bacterium]
AGFIRLAQHQDDEAITDFEIGLKHNEIRPEVNIELRYQLGTIYLKMQRINEALKYLQDVESLSPSYKDTNALINKYKELNANKNLQIFIMASSAEFLALCRKVTLAYFPKARVKITKTQVEANDWADIVAEIDTPKWSDIVMFRFIRTQGAIGELVVRDFHSHLKDVKAGKGVCIGVGKYSDEAKRFTEARLIDLIDKERFVPILNNLNSQ